MCTLSTDPSVGLSLSEDDTTVKCYMADTGLLACCAFSSNSKIVPKVYNQVLRGELEVNEGMLMENAVRPAACSKRARLVLLLQILSRKIGTHGNRLPHHSSFCRLRPKAPHIAGRGKNRENATRPVSLDKFKSKFTSRVGTQYVLHTKQLKVEGDRVFLPLYMCGYL